MSKKITRRVVIGTVISGLAAGPFIIRALKIKSPIETSVDRAVGIPTTVSDILQNCTAQKQLFQEWNKYGHLFDISIIPQKYTESFSIPLNLPTNYKSAFTSINAELRGHVNLFKEASIENLIFWGLREGVIQSVMSPKCVFARLDKCVVKKVNFEGSQPTLDSLSYDLGTCSFYQTEASKLVAENNNGLSMWLLDQLFFSPSKHELNVGDSFEVSMPMLGGIRFIASVENIVQILNISAVKIILEKRLNKDDFNDYSQVTGKQLVQRKTCIITNDFNEQEFDEEKINDYEKLKTNIEEEIKNEQIEQPYLLHKTVLYIDLKTGITIRREDVSHMEDQTSFSIFQMS
ncbi:MAG: hypothetical protein LBJ67_06015 [Planctomycetaceae bacterium]|jgi:hypothetical protein|nr:hypothetical protein [Planctomycetaceae bacterium]